MGISSAEIQLLLELRHLGMFKNYSSVLEIGSQELHITKNNLSEMFLQAGLDIDLVDKIQDLENWPNHPRASSKSLYSFLGINNYKSVDLNEELGSIPIDLNIEFNDESLFGKFDLITDFGSCEHVFNVAEAYKTIHKLLKKNGLLIITQAVFKGNGYFHFDRSFLEGISAANNYKVIYSSYVTGVPSRQNSKDYQQFRIPLNDDLVSSLKNIQNLSIMMVMQKTSNEEFKIPYQGTLYNERYNTFGFNKIYHKNDFSESYIPKYSIDNIPFRKLVKEIFKRIKTRLRL